MDYNLSVISFQYCVHMFVWRSKSHCKCEPAANLFNNSDRFIEVKIVIDEKNNSMTPFLSMAILIPVVLNMFIYIVGNKMHTGQLHLSEFQTCENQPSSLWAVQARMGGTW